MELSRSCASNLWVVTDPSGLRLDWASVETKPCPTRFVRLVVMRTYFRMSSRRVSSVTAAAVHTPSHISFLALALSLPGPAAKRCGVRAGEVGYRLGPQQTPCVESTSGKARAGC
jgi:hypothetical protein